MYEDFDFNDVLDIALSNMESRAMKSLFDEDGNYDSYSIDTLLFEDDYE